MFRFPAWITSLLFDRLWYAFAARIVPPVKPEEEDQ